MRYILIDSYSRKQKLLGSSIIFKIVMGFWQQKFENHKPIRPFPILLDLSFQLDFLPSPFPSSPPPSTTIPISHNA